MLLVTVNSLVVLPAISVLSQNHLYVAPLLFVSTVAVNFTDVPAGTVVLPSAEIVTERSGRIFTSLAVADSKLAAVMSSFASQPDDVLKA